MSTTFDDTDTEWFGPIISSAASSRGRHWREDVNHTEDLPMIRDKPSPPRRARNMPIIVGAILVALLVQILGSLTLVAMERAYQVMGLGAAVSVALSITAVLTLAIVLYSLRD